MKSNYQKLMERTASMSKKMADIIFREEAGLRAGKEYLYTSSPEMMGASMCNAQRCGGGCAGCSCRDCCTCVAAGGEVIYAQDGFECWLNSEDYAPEDVGCVAIFGREYLESAQSFEKRSVGMSRQCFM